MIESIFSGIRCDHPQGHCSVRHPGGGGFVPGKHHGDGGNTWPLLEVPQGYHDFKHIGGIFMVYGGLTPLPGSTTL